jgi:uncharacterized membrane protein YqaE (UPF0057 family)
MPSNLFFIRAFGSLLIYNTEGDDATILEIQKFIKEKTLLEPTSYWIYSSGKRINKDDRLCHFDTIDVMPKMVGGGMFEDLFDDVFNAVFDAVMSALEAIFEPIRSPVMSIINLFKKLLNILIVIVKSTIWVFMLITWFIVEFANPAVLFNDFIGGLSRLTRFIMLAISDIFFAFTRTSLNIFGDSIFSGLLGWDAKTKQNDKKNKKGKDCEGVKCYEADYRQVPFSVVIATVLMPPLGVLMEFGVKYWVNIFVCAMLTLMFYFPGLLYALVLIYC